MRTDTGPGASRISTRARPNFDEARKVEIRVCVEDAWFDPCSNWETGYA